MYIAILGRQPALGIAELEKLHGATHVKPFSENAAVIDSDTFSTDRLGGTQKAGRITIELDRGDWRLASLKIIKAYEQHWRNLDHKITLGISAYGFTASPREIQKTGIVLKQKLKKNNVSLRLIPNNEAALNSATSHHNKLGLSDNKIELLVVRAKNGRVIVAESIGAQNITAYTRRDQERPKRDAFVGMLPPKLAQIIINLASPPQPTKARLRVLDPFCGTGVILQESALMGYDVYGTDLSDKMVEFSATNLKWLASSHHVDVRSTIAQGDAMTTKWTAPIDIVACETYLGQPFSAPPSKPKLDEVRRNCTYIISTFLKNIATQIEPGTPLCIAVPAWRDTSGHFTHLPLEGMLPQLGFQQHTFTHVANQDLLYYREDQVVARQLLVLAKS